MSQMKSAFERAMERAEALGALTPEEKLKIEFQPRGEAAAVGHMNGKAGLASSLETCGPDARPHFAAGASRVLVNSITLGLTEIDQERNARAFEGLRVVKSDKKALERAVALIDNIQSMYRQAYGPTVEQARQETRQRMEQAFRKRLGPIPACQPPVWTRSPCRSSRADWPRLSCSSRPSTRALWRSRRPTWRPQPRSLARRPGR